MPLPVRFVLVHPRTPENLGAAARALKNFGHAEWTWVRPPWAPDDPRARTLAVGAEDLLTQARLAPNLAAAVADCSWVVGPPGGHGSVRRRWIPKRSRPRLRAGPDGWRWCSATNVAASGERTSRCHALTRIPTDAGQPSLNVAQAVCVYAYALSRGSGRAERGAPRPGTDADLRRLEGVLDELLRRVCFVRPGRPGVGPLVASWRRSGLTRTEIRLWESAFRTLARSLNKPKNDGHLS